MTDVSITGVAAYLTATAPAGAVGLTTVAGQVAGLTIVAPAGTVDSYVIDRSGDVLTFEVDDSYVPSIPSVINVSVGLGVALGTATFHFDSETPFATADLDELGAITNLNLPVDDLTAGVHVLTVTDGSGSASLNITVAASDFDPEADPVTVAPTPVTTHWTWQETINPSITYTMPTNPSRAATPNFQVPVTDTPTVGRAGKILSFAGAAKSPTWIFNGTVNSQAEVEALEDWTSKPQRLYLTDHFGRRMTLAVVNMSWDLTRKPYDPWYRQYTLNALIFEVV